jgi:phenylacetate-CoA ligase
MPYSLCSTKQLERLQRHVAYAYEYAPFYRRSFGTAGVSPADLKDYADLARFPLVSKIDVIADQRAAPPFGTLLAVAPGALRRLYCSGGPLYLALSGNDIETAEAAAANQLILLGLRPGDLFDIASSFHWVFAGTMAEGAARRAGAATIPGGPGMSALRAQVLREAGVTALQAFTPYAETLGSELRQQGLDPQRDLKVRLLMIGGELRLAAAKERLSELWGGAAIRESYGTAETGFVAAECYEVGEGMHLSEDFVLEIIDPETGTPVPPEGGGEIVITELLREAQPFIRYRTGDITEGIDFTTCRCGRSAPRLKRIIGRKSSMLRVRGLFLYPEQVKGIVSSHPELRRCQLLVDRLGVQDVLTVRAEYAGDTPPEHLRAALQDEIKSATQLRCEVELLSDGTLAADAPLYEDRRQL